MDNLQMLQQKINAFIFLMQKMNQKKMKMKMTEMYLNILILVYLVVQEQVSITTRQENNLLMLIKEKNLKQKIATQIYLHNKMVKMITHIKLNTLTQMIRHLDLVIIQDTILMMITMSEFQNSLIVNFIQILLELHIVVQELLLVIERNF